MMLPTSRENQDSWEEVAGRDQEPEEEWVAEEEPEAEEDAEEDAGQSTPPITGRSLQATITNDIDSLFSPEAIKQISAEINI